jgi:light-regulated signal transduction histidine kinase (bacteriophytochrome)
MMATERAAHEVDMLRRAMKDYREALSKHRAAQAAVTQAQSALEWATKNVESTGPALETAKADLVAATLLNAEGGNVIMTDNGASVA